MVYIGQAYNFQKRWKNHRIELNLNRHCNPYLQSAWNKYGSYNFEFTIIENCEVEKLTEREQYWMDIYKSAYRTLGYNLAPAAGSTLGVKHSEETKTMWSEMRKGKSIHTEESKAAIGAKSKGRVFSAKSREKMRQSQLGKKQSEETKEKHRQRMLGNKFNTGRKQSDEEIAKRVASNTGQKRTEEAKAKMSAWQVGKVFSEETKLKMSLAAKRRWNSC